MDKMILYMKKVVFFLMLLLPFVSCDKNAEGVLKAELSISKNEIVLDSDASVEELVVKANTDWSINDIPDWCGTIRPSYGRAGEWTVRIRGRFYEGKENRTAELKVVAGDKTQALTLIQKGAKMIDVKLANPRIPSSGGAVTVMVVSDFDSYDVEVPQGADWLKITSTDKPLNGNITFTAAANATGVDRQAVIRFTNKENDYTKELTITQLCVASENRYYDGDVKQLLAAKKGKGVNIVLLGDGFVAEDLAFGGEFDKMIATAQEAIFACEPMASLKDYINIYAVAAESKEKGIGRVAAKNTAIRAFFRSEDPTNLTMNLDPEAAYAYMNKAGLTDSVNTAVLVICNTEDVGGTNISWPDGRCLALCTKAGPNHNGLVGVINHELVGHAIGRLDEGYVYNSGYVTDEYKATLAERHAKGWSLNVDTTDDPTKVAWKHFIGVRGYENVGCYNFAGGVVFMGGGVCEPENHFLRQDCMVTNELYFNAPSREQIVKHVYELAGVQYSFEDFIANDKLRGAH